MNVVWVESSGDKQLGAIALPLPMLHHDDRQAALHLQDESEHTMGQGTLRELQNSLFVFEIQSPAYGHWVDA